jgi:hypothetical protein
MISGIKCFIPIAIAAALLSGCSKSVPPTAATSSFDDAYIGKWKDAYTTVEIINKREGHYRYYYNSGGVQVNEAYDGGVNITSDKLTILTKELTINQGPTTETISGGGANTFVILDSRRLYKDPYKQDPCKNGFQDGNETGVDCGGICPKCPSCFDGIKNQDEEEIDCGGVCNACPNCDDMIKNNGETGIDCGGTCIPCASPTCVTAEGVLQMFIDNSNAGTSNVQSASYYPDLGFQTNYRLDLSMTGGGPDQISVLFYTNTFLAIQIGETARLTSSYSDTGNHNCLVLLHFQMGELNAKEGSEVFITRTAEKTYTVRFCKLQQIKQDPYNFNGSYNLNASFTIQ